MATKVVDALPAEVHGFTVTLEIGPPLGATAGKALHAWLRPATEANRKKLLNINRDAIHSELPLTTTGALELELDPNGRIAENLARLCLTPAVRKAKAVNEA